MSPDQDLMNRRALLGRGGMMAAGVAALTGAGAASGLAAASAATGLTFNTVTPYRAYDSREDSANQIAENGALYRIPVTTDMYGTVKINSAKAITYTITVVTISDAGFLSLLPGHITASPAVSSINWAAAGTVVATGGTVALGATSTTNRHVNVYCGGNGRTQYLLDVTGYYS